jgi:putative membrane protein
MTHRLMLSRLAGASALACLLAAAPVHAQSNEASSSGTNRNSAASSSDAPSVKTPSTSGSTSGASEASSGKLSSEDQEMMQDIAHANLAEIEVGKLALEKSKNEQVRKYAQRLIDDHTAAMKELEKLAQTKNASLPKETDIQHKAIATALQALSGETFDNQFIARVGVGDHERTHDLLQKTQKTAQDKDLKAYAQKTLKVIDQHLAEARKMEKKK